MSNHRDMSGALFRETDKKSDRAPDYTGSLTIHGTRYRLAGWVKAGREGKKFLSIAASLPEDRSDDRRQQRQPDHGGPDWDSQIPF
jgi:hypothetical protein